MYWTQREPIQENRERRKEFIKAGLEEIDEDIKVRLRNIKWKKDGPRYP